MGSWTFWVNVFLGCFRYTGLKGGLLLLVLAAAPAHSITVSAAFSPNVVVSGGSSTLTWTTDGVSCEIDGKTYFGRGGSVVFTNITATRDVKVLCSAPQTPSGYTYARIAIAALPPGAPASFSISPTSTTNTSVTASWGSVAGEVTAYEAQRRLDSGAWSTFYSGPAITAISSDMAVGAWGFQVRACNNAGCSSYTQGNGVTIQSPPPPIPGVPSSLNPSATTTTATTLSLLWNLVSGRSATMNFNGSSIVALGSCFTRAWASPCKVVCKRRRSLHLWRPEPGPFASVPVMPAVAVHITTVMAPLSNT